MVVFSYNMKKYRKKSGLTQEKLAEIIGTETSYIGQLEINYGKPSMDMVEKIAKALNIEPFRLFVDDAVSISNNSCVSDNYLEGLTAKERQDLLNRIMTLISSNLEQILQPEKKAQAISSPD